jgi:hypothetical protein
VDSDVNGGTPDYLRAQKIDGMGNLTGPEGAILGNIYTTEFEIASDDSRGAIVVWSLGDGDIYAKRLTPVIGYSPVTLSFLEDYEGDNPPEQTLTISNTGYDTLEWLAESDGAWLSVSPTSGNDSGTVNVSADISGLLPGTYTASITISGIGALNSPAVVPVTLTISRPSKMILLTPDEGEIIPSGSTYPIKWIGPEEAVKFKLKYSLDNGATWKAMHPEPYVTGTEYLWEVPRPPGNKKSCLVKITGYSMSDARVSADQSDSPFTIVLKLDYPDGGEPPFTSGQDITITWTTHATISPVNQVILSYTVDNGLTWKPFLSQPPAGSDPGSHTVQLPAVKRDKSNCKVKVVLKDGSGKKVGSDISNGVFTLLKP